MAGTLIPMRELRALAKRAGYEIRDLGYDGGPVWWYAAVRVVRPTVLHSQDAAKTFRGVEYVYLSGFLAKGMGRTQPAAQIQARENAKLFLECVLAMRYGEGE